MALKEMALKYTGRCRVCSTELPARTRAVYDTDARNVLCLGCRDRDRPSDPWSFLPPPEPIDPGTAGAGPRAEYERRVAAREREIEPLGGWRSKLVRAIESEPRSAAAWRLGADGERELAAVLERRLTASAVVLHSRRVPGTRGDIDHLVVAPSGLWILDAKNHVGPVACRAVGRGSTVDLRLVVNGRDRTALLSNVGWQVAAVRAALDPIGLGDVAVHTALVFVQWRRRLFQRPFRLDAPGASGTSDAAEVLVTWPSALADAVNATGPLGHDAVRAIATELGAKLPAKR